MNGTNYEAINRRRRSEVEELYNEQTESECGEEEKNKLSFPSRRVVGRSFHQPAVNFI